MGFVQTPNMSLPVPVVGQEDGPQYAIDVNSCFTLLDQHDHSPGKGVAITPSGINVNTALTFNNNFATNVAGITFFAQSATPAISTLYENGVDIYYVDGNGNNVRLTQNGNVAGSTGSISGLTSPASAAYNSGTSTFIWQSNTGVAANMDFGAALLRNLSPNSTFALTLQPPAALSANYTITLPTLPSASAFLTIDNSGNVSSATPFSGGLTHTNLSASAGIVGTQLSASAGIVGTQLSASAGIVPGQTDNLASGTKFNLTNGSGSFSTSSTSFVAVTNLVSPSTAFSGATSRPIFVMFQNDGSGNPSSIVVSGGTATFEIITSHPPFADDVHNTITLPAGTYPLAVLNTITPAASGPGTAPNWTFYTQSLALKVKVSAGSVQVNNATMAILQV